MTVTKERGTQNMAPMKTKSQTCVHKGSETQERRHQTPLGISPVRRDTHHGGHLLCERNGHDLTKLSRLQVLHRLRQLPQDREPLLVRHIVGPRLVEIDRVRPVLLEVLDVLFSHARLQRGQHLQERSVQLWCVSNTGQKQIGTSTTPPRAPGIGAAA
jgi:hypothetical protein